MNGFIIERISERTLAGAQMLEELCFSSPWSLESLRLLCGEGAVGFVALDEKSGEVLAYGGMLTVLDEGQITNIATHPDARRRGLGERVTGELLKYGAENGLTLFSLEVRESNSAARLLYLSEGWREDGVRKNFYRLPTENAILMSKSLRI